MGEDLVLTVSDFVAVLNQTLEYAYPSVMIVGELSNLRVSKGKWVYFDLKDETASVKFFGTVFQMPGPLEDGMMVQVRGLPRLHPLFGFSVNVQFMQPVGEGSLKKAAALLEAKLTAEGLFDPARKRPLPRYPQKIGLVTSGESAAYRDFMKILDERWGGIEVILADVQVQGEPAVGQIVNALEHFNTHDYGLDALVVTRGGGSADDLAAFSTEQVTRAVAGSRIPTIVAIGHEVDTSLAELAADLRASTPSNAVQLLVPDRREELAQLAAHRRFALEQMRHSLDIAQRQLRDTQDDLHETVDVLIDDHMRHIREVQGLLRIIDPKAILRRGYAIVRSGNAVVRSVKHIHKGQPLEITLQDGTITSEVQ